MIIKAVKDDGSERLIGCSDIGVNGSAAAGRIEIELCEQGKGFETIVVPDDCEVVYVLSDAKGAKGEKVQTYSLRQKATVAA